MWCFLVTIWKTPMAFSYTPSGAPVWSNYPEKLRCVGAELDYSNGTQCFYKPPNSWIIIIIICMCLAKSLIGNFQNETMLQEKKLSSHSPWKKNQNTANPCISLNHQIMQKGLWYIAFIPSFPLSSCGPMVSTIFNSFSCFSWRLSLNEDRHHQFFFHPF